MKRWGHTILERENWRLNSILLVYKKGLLDKASGVGSEPRRLVDLLAYCMFE